ILAAASELVATRGIGASTAKIAEAAGVSEGTLFTYFATKDDLLNQLFLEIQTELAATLLASCPATGSPRERIGHVWDRLGDWGGVQPMRRKAMRQLKVSDRTTAETRQRGKSLFHELRETVEQSLAGHIEPDRSSFYIDCVFMGLAEITIEAIA